MINKEEHILNKTEMKTLRCFQRISLKDHEYGVRRFDGERKQSQL